MSLQTVFSLDRFRAILGKYEIPVEVDISDGWRFFLIFDRDRETGAFTADIIEPFAHVCHDMIDMDVSNLYVKSGFVNELGMRISLDSVEPKDKGGIESISVEDIVKHIQDKEFSTLRSDVIERVKKMEKRGWRSTGKEYKSVLPSEKISSFTMKISNKDDNLYKFASDMMAKLGPQIVEIYLLTNPAFDKIYEGQRDLIKRSNNNQDNEALLFHGTSKDGADGIIEGSFDNRFYKDGAWGYGAYFADDPNKSNTYAPPDGNGIRCMFICKVLLGKEEVMTTTKNGIVSPSKGFDSVRGTGFQFTEYIVYRFGQAKPYLLIKYKK